MAPQHAHSRPKRSSSVRSAATRSQTTTPVTRATSRKGTSGVVKKKKAARVPRTRRTRTSVRVHRSNSPAALPVEPVALTPIGTSTVPVAPNAPERSTNRRKIIKRRSIPYDPDIDFEFDDPVLLPQQADREAEEVQEVDESTPPSAAAKLRRRQKIEKKFFIAMQEMLREKENAAEMTSQNDHTESNKLDLDMELDIDFDELAGMNNTPKRPLNAANKRRRTVCASAEVGSNTVLSTPVSRRKSPPASSHIHSTETLVDRGGTIFRITKRVVDQPPCAPGVFYTREIVAKSSSLSSPPASRTKGPSASSVIHTTETLVNRGGAVFRITKRVVDNPPYAPGVFYTRELVENSEMKKRRSSKINKSKIIDAITEEKKDESEKMPEHIEAVVKTPVARRSLDRVNKLISVLDKPTGAPKPKYRRRSYKEAVENGPEIFVEKEMMPATPIGRKLWNNKPICVAVYGKHYEGQAPKPIYKRTPFKSLVHNEESEGTIVGGFRKRLESLKAAMTSSISM